MGDFGGDFGSGFLGGVPWKGVGSAESRGTGESHVTPDPGKGALPPRWEPEVTWSEVKGHPQVTTTPPHPPHHVTAPPQPRDSRAPRSPWRRVPREGPRPKPGPGPGDRGSGGGQGGGPGGVPGVGGGRTGPLRASGSAAPGPPLPGVTSPRMRRRAQGAACSHGNGKGAWLGLREWGGSFHSNGKGARLVAKVTGARFPPRAGVAMVTGKGRGLSLMGGAVASATRRRR